ncbi:PREDICTED: gustatory receptor 5a for trehalose-like [Acromyrmex echinatior]|uniref:gustatory receptor 5a for trehalose-like n=1 Tax=Acromyrmex echinatior TaxID=103372 RepID=UPI000580FAFC|nr:PREDICTED: gustatory receptor 5a for trehalose-like [Acromyrmex echinatior]
MSIKRRIYSTTREKKQNSYSLSPKNLRNNKFDSMKTDMVVPEMLASVVPSSDIFNPSTDSLHAAMRPIILLAQCFGMFPVCGVNKPDASYLRFTWYHPKIFYAMSIIVGTSILTVTNIHRLVTSGVNSTKMTTFVFFLTTLITAVMFIRLAMHWPCLALTWEKLEREFTSKHRRISKTSLATRFKIVTFVVMLLAFGEHSAAVMAGYNSALECAAYRGDVDVAGIYFISQFPQNSSMCYFDRGKKLITTWKSLLLLTTRRYYLVKAMPEWWWAEARNDYNHLATLTRRVDTYISGIVLMSFAIDLYFICMQLLFSFNPIRGSIRKIYFGFSFGFLLARTMAVSLYAASIHDESRLPAPILYSVTSSGYSNEVSRFLTQVTTDNISLTGMKFFSITRGLVLTVAGTIVTYELVLVQFNSVQQADQTNITACEVR